MEFDYISLADEAETQRPNRHAIFDADISSRFMIRRVNFVMHDPALGSKKILIPQLLDVDKGALALAEDKMLQGR
jgi:hypothetical protein